jgi:hypothetical protein
VPACTGGFWFVSAELTAAFVAAGCDNPAAARTNAFLLQLEDDTERSYGEIAGFNFAQANGGQGQNQVQVRRVYNPMLLRGTRRY